MPVDIETLKYIPRAQVQNNSLGAVDNAVNKLAARHDATIERQSAINEYLGKIKLNSAEDQWKFNKMQEINDSINQEAEFGNYAGALTTAVKQAGNLAASPELHGRMRAQEDYEQFKQEVDNNRFLDGRTKQWAKELNPYSYQDKYDEKGNVIGGTKWEPLKKPVNQVDKVDLMGKVMQIAAKKAGGGNTIYYMGRDGKLTPEYNKSIDGLAFVNKEGKYEELPKDTLKLAMEAVINNTPGAKESIEQDYEVSKYFLKKEVATNPKTNVANRDITDARGLLLNRDQYLNKLLDPFYKSASYYHSFTSSTPGPGQSVAAERMRSAREATANASTEEKYTPSSVSAGNIETLATSAAEYKADSYKNRSKLMQMASTLKVKVPVTASTDALYNIIANRLKQNPALAHGAGAISLLEEAAAAKEAYHENVSSFNDMIKGASTTDRMAAEFVSHLDSNSEMSDLMTKGNIYASQYANSINKVYGGSGKNIRYTMSNESFIAATKSLDAGIRGSHVKAGFKTGRDDNGNMYIELNKADAFKLHQLQNVMTKSGSISTSVIDFNGKTIERPGIGKDLDNIKNIYTKTNDKYGKLLNNRPAPLRTSLDSFADEDIMISELTRQGLATGEKIEKLKFKLDIAKEAAIKNIRTYEPANFAMYEKAQDGGTFRSVNDGNSKAIKMGHIKTLLGSSEGSKRVNVTTGMHQGVLGTIITVAKAPVPSTGTRTSGEGNAIPDGYKGDAKDRTYEDGGYTIFVPNLIHSAQRDIVESDPEYKAKTKLQNAQINGKSEIRLNSNYTDNPALPDTKIILNKDGSFDYMLGKNRQRISKEKAIELQRANDDYRSLKNVVRTIGPGNISPEQKASIDATFIKSLFSQLEIKPGTPLEQVSELKRSIINNAYANLE